jgi:hypothetical protein
VEITPNSFSLRGGSGLVKVVSDSTFDPRGDSDSYSEDAECDVIVESKGFRVNKAMVLDMREVAGFLGEVRSLVDRGEGLASLSKPSEGFSLVFICEGGRARVECSMNDAREGRENVASVKYPIESEYLAVLRTELARMGRQAGKAE